MISGLPIGKIRITLAIKGDGALPEHLPDSLGHITVGPHGFLGALETQLGIPASDVSFTTRLVQYLACVEQCNHPEAFYHASYEADPFSVARALLQWRDQWYLAGWQGTFNDAPAKLLDMGAIEQTARNEVTAGLGQRIQRVIELLHNNPIAVESISLRDELADFPYLWRKLIEAVDAPITEQTAATPQAEEGTDLRNLQNHLLAATNEKIRLLVSWLWRQSYA